MAKKIELSIDRIKGKTFFNFEIAPEITEVFKNGSSQEKESGNWPGNKFYYVPEITSNENYKTLAKRKGLYDDYGQPLIQGTSQRGDLYFNIAWIRTVGGKGKIEIKEMITIGDLSEMLNRCTSFLKEYFENYFRDAKITAGITVEL